MENLSYVLLPDIFNTTIIIIVPLSFKETHTIQIYVTNMPFKYINKCCIQLNDMSLGWWPWPLTLQVWLTEHIKMHTHVTSECLGWKHIYFLTKVTSHSDLDLWPSDIIKVQDSKWKWSRFKFCDRQTKNQVLFWSIDSGA